LPEKGRAGGGDARNSEEAPNPKAEARGTLVLRTRPDEENPEVVMNDEGGAPEANKALLVGH